MPDNYSSMLHELEQKIEYTFNDRELLLRALTHSSYASEHGMSHTANNERLEFIGDAYLDAIIGQVMFNELPGAREGALSKLRAGVVCERSLASVARQLKLGDMILLSKGEALSGGGEKDSILADAVEAIIGAVVIDGGFASADRMVRRLFAELVRLSINGSLYADYKTALQEQMQRIYGPCTIKYTVESESGPDHNKTFTVSVSVNGQKYGTGTGHSKKEAEQEAAKDAMSKEKHQTV